MAYNKVDLEYLSTFLPEHAYHWVLPYLKNYAIDLKITQDRKSKLGDYIFHPHNNRHKISINGSLNRYEFFFTFIHELAHLITFNMYKHTVDAHGTEWKNNFRELLRSSIQYFPTSLQQVILKHIDQMKSAQCYDTKLFLEFKKYDEVKKTYVSDLSVGDIFTISSGEQFKILSKRRTRYLCENIRNHKQFLFPSLYEVQR